VTHPRIIFLDIDGVLNYHMMERNRPMDPAAGSAWFKDRVAYICEQRTRLLNQIDAEFVLSSSWRHITELHTMQRILEFRGFSKKLIGRTPFQSEMTGTYSRRAYTSTHLAPRGFEIAEWLDANPAERFVIVDDSNDMEHLTHRLVRTDYLEGLTQAHVDKIKEMLV